MSEKTEVSSAQSDGLKWAVVFLLVAGAVYGNHYFSAESLLYRVLGILAILGVALFVGFQTVKGREFATLLKDARTEIRKVVWPNRQETVQTTLIVVVFVIVVAIFLWGVDSLTSWLISLVIG